MRLLILFTVLLAIDLYAFQAFRTIAQGWTSLARLSVYILYWSIPLLAIAMVVAGSYVDVQAWNKNLFTLLRAFIFIAYLSKTLVVAPLLIDDLRRVFYRGYELAVGEAPFNRSRSRFLSQMGILLGSIPFVTLTYGIIRNAYRYRLYRETVRIPDLPAALDGLRIVQISDVHSGSFTLKEPVRNAIDLINRQEADLVFFTGDLVNYQADEMAPFMDVFDKIQARHGVYSVLGNHDYGDYVRWDHPGDKERNLEKLKGIHRSLGWDLLLNENRLLEINGEQVAVLGVENYSAHLRFPKYGDLARAHAGTEGAGLKLLLSHDPSHWEDQITRDFRDVALTFSGHTHGFQFGIEIPGWIKWSPIKYVYRQWAGLYQRDHQYLYVNRGLGFLGYPGRVGILPEVALLELRKG